MCSVLHLNNKYLTTYHYSPTNTLRNLIRADVISFEDYAYHEGDLLQIRMNGKLKSETRKYVVNDGDVVEFFYHEFTTVVV